MSAWFAFTALGFYPVTGEDYYFVGSPLVTQANLTVAGGNTVVINVVNQSPENVFVERVERNGAPFESAFVYHDELVGATFTFYMSSTADTAYNRATAGRIGGPARRRV